MSWLDFVLGSSPGAAVGEAGSKVLEGVFGSVKSIIQEFHLSPEQEMKLNLAMEQQRLSFFQARVQDVQSARQMEMVTRSRMPALLSIFYSLAFVAISTALLWWSFGYPDAHMNNFQAGLIGLVYGYVAKEAALGSAFYLGGTIKEDDYKVNDIIRTAQANGMKTTDLHVTEPKS